MPLENTDGPQDPEQSHPNNDPIAVVGMACRFPAAPSVEDFWSLLHEGGDAITEVPTDRWDLETWYDPESGTPGKMHARGAGFIEDVYSFDAEFFGIAPREANSMDPQQRLLLETVWQALENSGYAPGSLVGSPGGIYIGISTNDYLQVGCRLNPVHGIDPYSGTGTATSIASGQISYLLGLEGPNFAVDTACSSSLVAAHLACQSLRRRECRFAVCAGVNLILAPQTSVYFCKLGILSPESRCKTFDASADGYVRGEGCGAVVFKRLVDAQSDGDTVLAVIRGSAINHDGRSSGLTAPSGSAQQVLLKRALDDAGVTPDQVDYVEAHGTGTPLGDPIELHAIGAVHKDHRPGAAPLMVASVKTNIGHLEAASGIAGLIKVVLALQHGVIPAHLHFRQPNPYITWNDLPVTIPTAAVPWPQGNGERLAGLSSFGFSGTNAHMIVAEPPPVIDPSTASKDRPTHLLCLSAKTAAGLTKYVQSAIHCLEQSSPASWPNRCYTANVGRSEYTHRLCCWAPDHSAALRALMDRENPKHSRGLTEAVVSKSQTPKIAFLFAGQGTHYPAMARELYDTQPVFKRALGDCQDVLNQHHDHPPISDVLYDERHQGLLEKAGYAQTAIFAVEYALAQLWRSWGVQPDMVVGHSNGEYAAACVAGMLRLEDALELAAMIGLVDTIETPGMMVDVQAGADQVATVIAPWPQLVAIAAVNSPSHTVVSGCTHTLQTVVDRLESEGVQCKRLNISQAFHSPLLDPLLSEIDIRIGNIQHTAPHTGLVSGLSGELMTPAHIDDTRYWRRQLREPVRFADAMGTLEANGCNVYLELSPQPALLPMARQCRPHDPALWLPSLRPDRSDWTQMLLALRDLYLKGADIDWRGFDRPYRRRIVAFPNYPFQKKSYTNISPQAIERHTVAQTAAGADLPTPGMTRLRSTLLKETVYQIRINSTHPTFLKDHRIYGMTVVPGMFYLALVLTAGIELHPDSLMELSQVNFITPLILNETDSVDVELILSPDENGQSSFRALSRAVADDAEWVTHAVGQVKFAPDIPIEAPLERMQTLKQTHIDHGTDADRVYSKMGEFGYFYGPSFRWIYEAWQGQREALADVRLPEGIDPENSFALHPGLMDACTQALALTAVIQEDTLQSGAYIPTRIDTLRFRPPRETNLSIYVTMPKTADPDWRSFTADISLCSPVGEPVLQMLGVRHQYAPRNTLGRLAQQHILNWLYRPEWTEQALDDTSPADESRWEPNTWLVFADETGVAHQLAESLRPRGVVPVLVYPATEFQQTGGHRYTLNPECERHFSELLEGLKNTEHPAIGAIVFLWSLTLPEATDIDDILQAQNHMGVRSLLRIVQSIATIETGPTRDLPLWVCTRGVHCIDPSTASQRPVQAGAAIWGMTATLAMEQPRLACIRIDLDPDADAAAQGRRLFDEIKVRSPEDQIAHRGSGRYVQRLRRFTPPARDAARLASTRQAYRLRSSKQGTLKDLHLVAATRTRPAAGQVEIEVHATGLNFRDVLSAMNLYPGDPGPLGLECAGRVTAVGEGVAFAVGDRVLAMAPGCFSSHTLTDARLVAALPDHMTYDAGATVPVTFLTAQAVLVGLAAITAEDTVLIHAGAGGVGQAAIQIARQAGAQIFSTAGSPAKRDHLREQGVAHVFDSRSLNFADEINAVTEGRGVDVVLNCLSGDYIPKSLASLAHGGRFVEIGKIDIWDAPRVAAARPDVAYHIFALDDLVLQDIDTVAGMLDDLMPAMRQQRLQALPQTTFEIEQASQAFQFMAQAKQIGKVVLTHPVDQRGDGSQDEEVGVRQGTYLITGGLGGLGLVLARWLVQQGVRSLALMGRRPPSEEARESIDAWRQAGTTVTVHQADVSQRSAVNTVLERIDAELPPLKGVFHAAGIIDDGLLTQLDWPRFERVLAPKVAGAAHLHELTRSKDLDTFVLFSSVASMLGSPGQSNYAAANAFLDNLAHHRRAMDLPALSINWGPWQRVGMTARLGDTVGRHWSALGIGAIPTVHGLTALELLMEQPYPQIGVLNIDWQKFSQRFPAEMRPPALRELIAKGHRSLEPSEEWLAFVETLRAALPASRQEMMVRYLQERAVDILELDSTADLDPDVPLNELGFDSLMAVELANILGATAGVAMNPTVLFDYPTLSAIGGYFVEQVLELDGDPKKTAIEQASPPHPGSFTEPHAVGSDAQTTTDPGRQAGNQTTESILQSIDTLTDTEIERLFSERLPTEEN